MLLKVKKIQKKQRNKYLMDKLKIFEEENGEWIEKDSLEFGIVILGEKPIGKTICFSPVYNDIINLEAKVEYNENFIFTESFKHLGINWMKINPDRIKIGDKSSPVKIEFSALGDKARMDYFKVAVKYLEVPSNT